MRYSPVAAKADRGDLSRKHRSNHVGRVAPRKGGYLPAHWAWMQAQRNGVLDCVPWAWLRWIAQVRPVLPV